MRWSRWTSFRQRPVEMDGDPMLGNIFFILCDSTGRKSTTGAGVVFGSGCAELSDVLLEKIRSGEADRYDTTVTDLTGENEASITACWITADQYHHQLPVGYAMASCKRWPMCSEGCSYSCSPPS